MDVEEALRARLPGPLFAAARSAYNVRPSAVLARRRYGRDKKAGIAVAEAAGWVVQRGPFTGMRYVEAYGDLGAKIIGSYEQELHQAVEGLIAVGYDNIINVGAAEGYYAVGFALRCPKATVVAYETSPTGRSLCKALARLNGVDVDVRGTFTEHDRADIPSGQTLFLMDIEGGELPLLDPVAAPALSRADHLVELHDFVDSTIKPTILTRFRETHRVRIISSAARRAVDYPELTWATARVLNEHRPRPMEWALLTRR